MPESTRSNHARSGVGTSLIQRRAYRLKPCSVQRARAAAARTFPHPAPARTFPPISRQRKYHAVAALTLVMLALMPMVSKTDATSDALSPSRVLEVAFEFLALVVSAFAVLRYNGAAKLRPAGGAALISITFGIWAMTTALFSPFLLLGMVKAGCLIVLSAVAYLTAVAVRAKLPQDSNAFVDAAANAFTITLCILLLGNCVLWKTPIPLLATEGEERVRLFLGNNHPLQSAEFLSIGLVLVIQSGYRLRTKIVMTAVLFVLLVLAGGRGVGVGTALGCILMAMSAIPRSPFRLLLQIVAGLLIAGSLVAAFASFDVLDVLASIVGEDLFSLNGRLDLWQYAFDLSLQHPLMGVGYYNSRFYILDIFEFAGHTHNSLLEALVGTGFTGGLLLFAFLGCWIRAVVRHGGALLGMFPALFLAAVLDPIVFTPGLSQFMLVYLITSFHLQPAPLTIRARHIRAVEMPRSWWADRPIAAAGG